jgi:hypothetical protein
MRKPRGFTSWSVPTGDLYSRWDDDGGWVVLAAEPDVKIDNRHRDGRPHLHLGGWDSPVRRDLRPDLTLQEAVAAIVRHLSESGSIDVPRLQEELS